MPPSEPSWNRLRRAATGPAAIFAGRCAYAASQFATLVAVGRWCGTEAVGEVVLGLAIAVPLFAFFGGQLRVALATDGEGRFAFRSVERVGLAGHLAAIAIFAAIAFALRQQPGEFATLMGVGLARAVESWSEIAHGRLQRRRELTAIGLSTALRSVLGLVVAVGILVASDSVGLAYAASAAVGLLISFAVDRKLAISGRSVEASENASLRELLSSVLPLAMGAALATFDTQLPRYFVEAFLGSTSLGSFGAAHYAALALLTLVIPLTYSWTPALADDVSAGDRLAFERRTRRALGVSIGIAVFAAILAIPGARVLAFAFDDPALLEGWTFPLVVLAAGVLAPAAVLETALRAARGFRTLSFVQGVSLAVHAGFCFEGLRLFGLEGVAAGMLARSIVFLALLAVGLRIAKSATFGPMSEARRKPDSRPTNRTDSTRAAA